MVREKLGQAFGTQAFDDVAMNGGQRLTTAIRLRGNRLSADDRDVYTVGARAIPARPRSCNSAGPDLCCVGNHATVSPGIDPSPAKSWLLNETARPNSADACIRSCD